MRRCPFCEKEIRDDADRCEHCGVVFNGTAGIDLDDLNKAFASPPGATGINLDDLNKAFTEAKKPSESEPDAPPAAAPTVQLQAELKLAGRYKLICEVGRGGMGVVWLAHDERLDMDVAVKVLPPELARDERGLRVLTNEAKLSMQLSHPNIVRLHTLQESDGLAYLIIEYVRGRTLDRLLLKKQKFTVEETLKYAEQICAGLEYAHEKRVIHRDLKPSNLMLTKDGSVKIADFGVARQIRDSMSRVSKEDTAGTLLYMSPEQLMGDWLDQRSDIYSLGIVLYELLKGEPPFVTGDVQTQIRFKDPAPIEGIPDAINRALFWMLAKKPADRPGSATDSLKALRGEIEKPIEERPQEPPGKLLAKAPRRPGVLVIVLGVIAALLVGVVISSEVVWRKQQREDREAEEAQQKAEGERRAEAARKEAEAARGAEAEARRKAEEERAREQAAAGARTRAEAEEHKKAEQLAREKAEQERRKKGEDQRILAERKANYETAMAAGNWLLRDRRWAEAEKAYQKALAVPGYERDTRAREGLEAARRGADAKRRKVAYESMLRLTRSAHDKARGTHDRPLWEGVGQQAEAAIATGHSDVSEAKHLLAAAQKNLAVLPTTLDGLLKRLAECEEARDYALKYFVPGSAKVRSAERDLKAARDRLRRTLLEESDVASDLKALRARCKTMSAEMRPSHPEMKALSAKIKAEEQMLRNAVSKLGDVLDAENAVRMGLWSAGTRRVRAATPAGEEWKEITYYKNTIGMEFVKIPAGEFMMGSAQSPDEVARSGGGIIAEYYKDEHPRHRVRITKAFYMGAFEVTRDEYQKIMGKGPASRKVAKNPVEFVSWYDADEFCRRLSKCDGVTYRLPTEAEWEYACRAGTTTPFHAGETISTDLANYDGGYTYGRGRKGIARGKTLPAGSFPPNGFGLYDTHGNVWEWCRSLCKEYPYRSDDGREDLRSAGSRVLRGGSWGHAPKYVRSAARYGGNPSRRHHRRGFRVTVSAQESF